MQRVLIAGNVTGEKAKQAAIGLSYLRAVRAVGSVPAVAVAEDMDTAQAYAQAFDALLLPGGNDLPGDYFGQPSHVAASFDDPMRDQSDRLLMEAFRAAGKRILGICRGCQVTNAFLGGTLHQHLPDAFDPVLWHSGNITGRHAATVEPDSLLASLVGGGEIKVNSSHHQAVAVPGSGLRVVAHAPDGVVEALEGKDMLLLQWHPEQMMETMRPVFEWLVGES